MGMAEARSGHRVCGSAGGWLALRPRASHSPDATLIPVLAWIPPGGDLAERRHPSGYLRRVWQQNARERLRDALKAAFGSPPAGVAAEPLVTRGEPGRVRVGTASRPGDLLVIGTGRHGSVGRLAGGNVSRYSLTRACCPGLAVPPAMLELAARHGLRRWAFRHRELSLSELTAVS